MSDALVSNYDYVIVGAGSAGCVLANRLSEDPANSVLLIEAGKDDRHLFIRMPTALSIPMNTPRFNWGYWGQPEPYLDGRRMDCARGKVLGGSSAINGMVYVRGNPADFDQWEAEGAKGWSYADCLPYFKRAEGWMGGADDYRGGSGPLSTCNGNNMSNPLYQAFIDAGREAGYGVTDDYNGYRQEGFGPMHMTVRRGERCSTDLAYLAPARRRANLTVITEAEVDRLTFTGLTVTGLRYRQKGLERSVKARKEVILSAGSVGSPTLLQRSGVGPLSVLLSAGVPVRHELPGVGENLQDHLEVYFQVACLQPITLYKHLGLLSKALIGAQWLFFKSGLGASNQFETLGFIRSRAGVSYPDIQYHFLPVAISYDGRAPAEGHGFQLHVGPMRSKSRGHVRIVDSNIASPPQIKFNYMSHPDDWDEFRRCIRLSREILKQAPMDPYRGPEIQPGDDQTSDDQIDAFIRDNAESAYHPCGTVRMGAADDPGAVVDPQCRVIGVENLRVADSSIFPRITNGNLNAPSIMTGEKAADHILGRPPLARANDEPFTHPDWQNSQR